MTLTIFVNGYIVNAGSYLCEHMCVSSYHSFDEIVFHNMGKEMALYRSE